MNGCILIAVAALSLIDAQAHAQDGRKSYQLSPEGTWQQVAAPPAPIAPAAAQGAGTVDPQLEHVTDLLKRGEFSIARGECADWLKAHENGPQYDRALYLMAQAVRGTGDLVRAFYYCDQLLDEHGDSPIFQEGLQLQYEIADRYLVGAKDRFLGMRIVGRTDEAIEMLFRIQQRSPGSPVAEKALLRTADFYWANGDFDLAADAYRSYGQTYPRSPLVPQARLREAYSNLAQFRGPAFDSTAIINAKALLRQLAADYPDLARQENIAEKLEVADRQMARKLYLNADFYRRTHQPRAAVSLCKRLIATYPNAPEAADARTLLARLEPNAEPHAK